MPSLPTKAVKRLISTVPFREELVALLQKEKFEKFCAEKLIDSIDAAVIESIRRESWRHMSLEEYEKILGTYQESVEEHRKEMQQAEHGNAAAFSTDYEFLMNEIIRTKQRIKEEAQQLESNVQLDLNLEGKRRADLLGEVEEKAKVASDYLENKADLVQKSLKQLSLQAMRAIGGSAAAILLGFLSYKLFTRD